MRNPSVNRTCYGWRRKPGVCHSKHRLKPGLRHQPPRAGCLERWTHLLQLHDSSRKQSLNRMGRLISVDDLTAEERIELMGTLCDGLYRALAAPITPALAAELDRREVEADAAPDAGEAWPEILGGLRRRLR